jgi:2-polyprenyl-3-methyl-5-hydroxy-6-metoxy-1,4-benzoquinol methylase
MAWSIFRVIPFTPYPYVGERVACDLCGATETVSICEYDRRFKRLTTVACACCGLMRTDPMPTSAEIEHYYQSVYRWDYQLASGRPSRRHLVRSRRQASGRLVVLAPALNPGARILDFGSGAGVFLGLAKERGYSVHGIEPGSDYAKFARETFGVEVIDKSWEQVGEPIGPFDVITAVEVLEHLRNPVRALRWLSMHLADAGVIYVTVPNMLPNGKETFRRFHFAHLHHFTPTTLHWAAEACGLELDPRFTPRGTQMVFRKAAAPVTPAFHGNQGDEMRRLHPDDSVGRYLLSGAWLGTRVRQLGITVRDTFFR